MTTTRTWRAATAGLAMATVLTATAAPAAAQLPDLGLPGLPGDGLEDDGDTPGEAGGIPRTGVGGFAGYARSEGTTVFVGLPAALADGLAPVLDGLGVAGSLEVDGQTLQGLRIDLAAAQADLERAAAGEEPSSEAAAFVTNLLLASELADAPGSCTGGPTEVELPPDTPLLTLTVLGVDCAETDERAFADARIAGLEIRLSNLLELGLPPEVRDGLAGVIDALNDQLLGTLSEGLCTLTDPILDGLFPDGPTLCEDGEPFLQLGDPLDSDVPVVDLDLIAADGEVTQDGGAVTATATATLTGLNVLGIACAGGDGTEPFTFASTATSDGTTATREATAPDVQVRLCDQDQSILRLLTTDGPLGDLALLERIVDGDLLDGALDPVFDGVDTLLEALTTQAITQGQPVLGAIDGSGTSAGTSPFVVAQTLPLAGLPGLGDVLGEVAVVVQANATAVGVNALPAAAEPPAPAEEQADVATPVAAPERQLPRTGGGLLLGLVALGGAVALRRRDG